MKTKHLIIFFNVLVLLSSALFPIASHAQSSDNQRAIYIFRNDGDFNAFLNIDVDSITFSRIDLNGHEHPNVVVKEIWTPDSLYRVPLASIDSINFSAPDPVTKSDVFHLTESHMPYVEASTDSTVDFDTSIPSSMLPSIGQVVVSDIYGEPIEMGFAGRVTQIYETNGIIRMLCDDVTIKDIYDQLICVGKAFSYDDEKSPDDAPQRYINSQNTTDWFPVGKLTIPLFINSIGLQLKLDIYPKISADYVACFNVEGQEDHLKFVVHSTLDCVLDLNCSPVKGKRTISEEIMWPDETKIRTNIPGLIFKLAYGLFCHLFGPIDSAYYDSTLKDSIALDIGLPFKMELDVGYDSWARNKNNNGYIFELKSFELQGVSGSASINANASCGLKLVVKPAFWTQSILGDITITAGPKASGKFEADFDEFYVTPDNKDWYAALKNSQIKLSFLSTKITGTLKLFNFLDNPSFIWTYDWFPFTTLYLLPEFTLPDFIIPQMPRMNESNGYTSTTLATTISRNLLFPIKMPGIGLYDNNNELRYASYSDYDYWAGGTDGNAWDGNPLTIELNNTEYEVGTYTAAPIFKFFGQTVKASPFTHVTIPAEHLSVDKTNVDLQQGDTVYIQQTGGWGKYALYSDPSPQYVYSATFFDNEHDVTCASWPPDTSSIYENVSPMIRIIGNQVGGSSLIVKDLRSGDIETISVNVGEYQPIIVSADSLDFGNVKVGETSLPKSLNVTCSGISDNLTVKLEEDVSGQFTVSPTTLGPNGGKINVTFAPESKRGYSGVIIISGTTIRGEFISKKVSLNGEGVIPKITANPSSLTGFTRDYKTQTFTVTGSHLTGNLSLTSENADFRVSPTSISAAEAKNGKTVTVTFTPQSYIKAIPGRITISGGGADTVYVNLSGNGRASNNPPVTINSIEPDDLSGEND